MELLVCRLGERGSLCRKSDFLNKQFMVHCSNEQEKSNVQRLKMLDEHKKGDTYGYIITSRGNKDGG